MGKIKNITSFFPPLFSALLFLIVSIFLKINRWYIGNSFVLCIFIFSLLLPTKNFSSNIDSLQQIINTSKVDTQKVNLLRELFWEFKRNDIDKAKEYIDKSLDLAIRSDYKRGIGKAKYALSGYCIIKGDSDNELKYLIEAKQIFKNINDLDLYNDCLLDIGSYYASQNKYDKAISNILDAINYFESKNLIQELARSYNALGSIYNTQNNKQKAIEAFKKTLELCKESDFKLGIAISYNNIAIIYRKDGDCEQAFKNFNSALPYYKELNDKAGLAKLNNNLGLANVGQDKFHKALDFYNKALKLYQELNYKEGIAIVYTNFGEDYKFLKQYEKARYYLEKSISVLSGLKNKKLLVTAYKILSEVHYLSSNFKDAYKYQKLYGDISDSLNQKLNSNKLLDLETKYETEKKEKQIEVLNKENEIKELKLRKSRIGLYSVIGFALLGLIVSFIFFRLLRQRQKSRELIQKQQSELKFTENLRNYYKLANMLPMIVFFLDKNKKLQYINDTGLKILNVTKKEFENGVDVYNLLLKNNKEEFENDIDLAFENRIISEKQYQLKLKNNHKLYILEYLSPNIENNEVTGILGVMVNITEIKELERKVISTVIETENKERKRFSEDLHDGLGPLLSSVKLYISGLPLADEKEKVEMLAYAKELIDESIKSVRNISNNIMPSSLNEKGLIHAIKMFCNKLEYTKTIDIVINNETTTIRYNQSIEIILYRVIQELINNTLKHANAKEIKIEFFEKNEQLKIRYQDNGIGYDINNELDAKQGLGLSNIISRVQSLNGGIKFNRTNQETTEVEIVIDL